MNDGASSPILPDLLGGPWLAETVELGTDREGAVVATVVSARTEAQCVGAVVHVHGFADYFFHTEYAQWWLDRGYDFYALDLRKYGRSLRSHQTATHVDDLTEHYPELDAVWQRVVARDGHGHVVLSGHSTGGLLVSLWAEDRRPEQLAAMVLNAPWLDLRGPLLMRTLGTQIIRHAARWAPLREIPRNVSGVYGRSLHRDHDGEWDFDLTWKPLTSFPVRLAWVRAIRAGHARVHAGLSIPVPILVLSSERTGVAAEVDETALSTDIVLDVEQIRRWAGSLGSHVTSVSIPGALHDVVLSRPDVRALAYDEMDRWERAYLPGSIAGR